ncbi:MAG: GNAT family N-acetyltransferase [Phototrophicaceae bacterium]
MVIIRPASASDIAKLVVLVADLSHPLTLEEGKRIFATIEAIPNHYTFVADDDGDLLGTYGIIIMQHFSHAGGVSAVINDVVVRANTQGQGIGTAMMQHAHDFAITHGCYKISLSSAKERELAHQFYEKLGYEQHGLSFLLPLTTT